MVNFLRSILGAWNGLMSFFRLFLLRVLGLRTGRGVRVGGGVQWPLGNVGNLQLGDNVSLGQRGWFYLPLNNRAAKIKIGAGTSVGNDFVITANNAIEIGRDCLLSYRVTVMDHSHVTGAGIGPVTLVSSDRELNAAAADETVRSVCHRQTCLDLRYLKEDAGRAVHLGRLWRLSKQSYALPQTTHSRYANR